MSPILLNTLLDDPGTRWLLIGAAMLLIVYTVIRPLARRKQDPLGKFGGAGGSMARQRGVEREMSNLLVELSEMARQVTAQLDTRAAKLELLIKEADEKIEALRTLTGAPQAGPAAPIQPTMRIVRDGTTERQALIQPLEAAPSPAPATDPRYAEIYALADEGCSAGDIASRLGRPRGEIELILALRQ